MARRRKQRNPLEIELDRLEVKHTSGLAENGRRWKVRGAPVGARVEAWPGRSGTARRTRLLRPAPNQVQPRCPVFGTCGGCQLQEMPLEQQRSEKAAFLERLLGLDSSVDVQPIIGTSQGYGYRNKLELSFGPRRYWPEGTIPAEDGPGSFLGFHPPGWFSKIVALEGCPLGSPTMNQVIARVVAAGCSPAWDSRSHTGVWRHLVVRDGGSLAEPRVLASLVTSSAADPAEVRSLGAALAEIPGVRGVLWVVTDGLAEVARGELRAILHGSSELEFSLGDLQLRLPHDGFFQVNTPGAELLFDQIAELLHQGGPPAPTLLDLYCGVGAVGLYLAHRIPGIKRLLGIEIAAGAVACAQQNAALNGIRGEWHAGLVEDLLPQMDLGADTTLPTGAAPNGDVPNCDVIVDPPRAGLHPRALAFLAEFKARRLIYVACNPASLARDRVGLEAGGWRLAALRAVDLFPQTHHLEVIARFER